MVKSPIVGTYYSSASPDKPPFVKVGQQVEKGDMLFIVESMKLMNEITSDYDGTVAEIMVESGKGRWNTASPSCVSSEKDRGASAGKIGSAF